MTNDKEWGVPLNNIVDYARLQSTQPRRQMFVKLLAYWIDKGGDEDAAREAIIAIQKGQVLTERSMPREFMPRYRSEILASKLIEMGPRNESHDRRRHHHENHAQQVRPADLWYAAR